jgi:hypothetical protein
MFEMFFFICSYYISPTIIPDGSFLSAYLSYPLHFESSEPRLSYGTREQNGESFRALVVGGGMDYTEHDWRCVKV